MDGYEKEDMKWSNEVIPPPFYRYLLEISDPEAYLRLEYDPSWLPQVTWMRQTCNDVMYSCYTVYGYLVS